MHHHYFICDYATGRPVELFRSSRSGKDFSDGCVERAKKDGGWSAEDVEIKPLLNLWLKGDFDPEEDAISEQEAQAYLEQWRSGTWPGRP